MRVPAASSASTYTKPELVASFTLPIQFAHVNENIFITVPQLHQYTHINELTSRHLVTGNRLLIKRETAFMSDIKERSSGSKAETLKELNAGAFPASNM